MDDPVRLGSVFAAMFGIAISSFAQQSALTRHHQTSESIMRHRENACR